MPFRTFRFRCLAPALLAAAAFSSCAGVPTASQAQENAIYTISNNDGYGISDCMHAGSDCGRAIADSWCEAHGHVHALSFGSTDDITGAIRFAAVEPKPAPGDVVIRCGD